MKFSNIRNNLKTTQKIERNKAKGLHTTAAGRRRGSVPSVPIMMNTSQTGWHSLNNAHYTPVKKYLNISL